MLTLLCVYSLPPFEKEHSLIPPLVNTNFLEIGNWSLRGTAVNIKRAVRLTSATENQVGSICHRRPSLHKEWRVELQISAVGGNGGCGFWFYFTKEVCPLLPLTFNGFVMWINTTDNDKEGQSSIFLEKSDGNMIDVTKAKPIGRVLIRGIESTVVVCVTKSNGKITVGVKDAKDNIINCGEVSSSKIPDYGYFTVTSVSSEYYDENEIATIKYYSISKEDNPEAGKDYSSINRKIIDDVVFPRRIIKQRRRAMLPHMTSFLEEINQSNGKLNGKNVDFNKVIDILVDIHNRANMMISIDGLVSFINGKIDKVLSTAEQKINSSDLVVDELETELTKLWSHTKAEVNRLSEVNPDHFKDSIESLVQNVENMGFKHINHASERKKLREKIKRLSGESRTPILFWISIVEFIAFVIFIIFKWFSTDKFKRA